MSEILLEDEARGWVQHTSFAGLHGWSLTESGRVENERQLADELASTGNVTEIADVYRAFGPLNARLQRACTGWQLRPTSADRLAENDHRDLAWDNAILDELTAIDRDLAPLAHRLGVTLARLGAYDTRFTAALRRARAGDGGWVDRTDVDSCHRVWFQLHEDLIATLGHDRERGQVLEEHNRSNGSRNRGAD